MLRVQGVPKGLDMSQKRVPNVDLGWVSEFRV